MVNPIENQIERIIEKVTMVGSTGLEPVTSAM